MTSVFTQPPRVGVGVVLHRGQQVLLGLRAGSHAAGEWAFPGGSVDLGEHPVLTAQREIVEEAGLELPLANFRVLPFWSNDLFPDDDKHFLTVFMLCAVPEELREPRRVEPDKCLRWDWFDWEQPFPTPLMTGTANLQQTFPTWTALTNGAYVPRDLPTGTA